MPERNGDQLRAQSGAGGKALGADDLLVGIRLEAIEEARQPDGFHPGGADDFQQLRFAFDDWGREADVEIAAVGSSRFCVTNQRSCQRRAGNGGEPAAAGAKVE